MTALRARRLPASAVLIVAAVGLLAIDVLRGGQGKLPAVAIIALVVGIRAVSFVADWRRVIIALLFVLFLIPNDGRYTLPIGLPFQLEPYRIVVGIFLVGWIASLLADRRVRFRGTAFDGPLVLLTLTVIGSEVVNPSRVGNVTSNVIKSLWLFFCLVLVVYMIVSVIRTREVLDRVIAAMLCAGCVVAIGAVIQMKTGMNIFDHLRLFLPLDFSSAVESTMLRGGHFRATASAGHPIELSATLSMLMPFAIYLAIKRRERRWWLAFVILLLGEFASGSRTGMLGVGAMVGIFLWLRPRQTIRFWPALLPMFVLVHFVAPGALGGVYAGFFPSGGLVAQQSNTFHGRQLSRLSRVGTSLHEYSQHNPLLGEGYGTRVSGGAGNYEAANIQTNSALPSATSLAMARGELVDGVNAEILDDQWLKTLLETGLLGVIAWLWLFARAIRRLGARAKLQRGSPDGWLPIALAAALLNFGISMGTYDAFSFIQATTFAFILIAFSSIVLHLPVVNPDEVATGGDGADPVSPATRALQSRLKAGRAARRWAERRGGSQSPSWAGNDERLHGRTVSLDLRRVVAGRCGEREYRAMGPLGSASPDVPPQDT